MKPFNLEEYLANPSRKVVTRNGRSVKIICTDRKHSRCPIVALVKSRFTENESIVCYTKEGKLYDDVLMDVDLVFAPEKKEGWVNIYKNEREYYFWKFIYPREADAKAEADSTCIATVKIEWEE